MIVGITLAGSALAADDPLLKAIKARQGEMQLRAFNAGPLFAMAKGDIDYDADLDNSRAWARGSDNEAYPGKTTSPPKIWTTYPEIGEYG